MADLRAENAALRESLRQSQADREEMALLLATKDQELKDTEFRLSEDGKALSDARQENAKLRHELAEADAAMDAARVANTALLEGLRQRENEVDTLSRRCQEAAADALGESEARASAERTVFALREQTASLNEQKNALRQQLTNMDRQRAVARSETKTMSDEAQALSIRMGLYRAVLRSDVAGIIATVH